MVALRLRRASVALLGAGVLVGCGWARASFAQPAVRARADRAATVATARDQYFTSGGARLRFRETGKGEPVVLVHGLTRSLEDWIGVGDSLARDHRVIVLDLRGFGRSTRFKDPRDYGVQMGDDIVRLLDNLGIARAHLVGHSLGAAIAANVAARYPDRVVSASLVAGPFRQDTASFARDDSGFVAEVERGGGMHRFLLWLFPGMPDSTAAAINKGMMAANDPAAIAATMRSMGALMVLPERAATIRARTLVAVGGRDPLNPESRWLASWWPRAQLLVVPDADHGNIAQRSEVLAAMRELMRSGPH